MTSTWKEPSTSDSHPGGELLGDRDTAGSVGASSTTSSDRSVDQPPRNFIDRSGSDAEELHRLEESIRWLMDAGTGSGRDTPLDLGRLDAGSEPLEPGSLDPGSLEPGSLEPGSPRRGPPPDPRPLFRPSSARLPIRRHQGSELRAPGRQPTGLRILDGDDDTLRLDPDTLFVPQQRRRGSLAASVAKVVVVSAIAAPTAYFIANWLQAPPAPVAPHVVAAPMALGDQGDGTPVDTAAAISTANARTSDDTSADRAVGVAVTVTPDPPVAVPPDIELRADAAPTDAAATEAAPPAVTAPAAARPPVSAQEAAKMLERGNTLFEAGDIISARLLFRRAAQAGNAAGATAMARSYDPDVLAKQMLGAAANEQEAQRWYARARELGDRDSGMIALH